MPPAHDPASDRKSRLQTVWLRQDFMATLPDLLQQWPRATLLFANSLGQQGLLHDSPAHTEALFESLKHQLQGRRWFSYHDRLSLHFKRPPPASLAAGLLHRASTLCSDTQTDSEMLAHTLLAGLGDIAHAEHESRDGQTRPAKQGAHVSDFHITDHLTGGLIPDGYTRRYSILPVTDTALHIVEAAWVYPPDAVA